MIISGFSLQKEIVKFSHFEKSEKETDKQCSYDNYHRGEWY